MFKNKKYGGFTLLEMLVVVLIIGILAGIALPQYENAVKKAQITEVLLNISHVQKGIDIYLLQNGYPEDSVEFFCSDLDNGPEILDIDIGKNMDCEGNSGYIGDYEYQVYCGSDICAINAWYEKPRHTIKASISAYKSREEDVWVKEHDGGFTPAIISMLESQGYRAC